MPDPPPNSPIDIRAHIRYDKYQRISTDKSYKNYEKLCEILGNEAMSYEEYEKWFNQYLEENYYSTKDGRDLPIPDIRGCILSDVTNGKSAEKSVDDLCDAFNNHKIDKEDHGYWYKRFENGHLFTRVTFSDFPEGVIAEIVEKCDIKSYFNLRNVSFGLRTVIDRLAPPCNNIGVRCCGENMIMVHSNLACISDPEFFDKTKSQASSKLVEVLSLKALEHFLKNPKFLLKFFKIVLGLYTESELPPRNYNKRVLGLFSSLEHTIHIEKCVMSMENENELIGVLKCLKPGTLEKLSIDTRISMDGINEVVKMDQWKMAKHLKIFTFVLPPIENFFHFPSFELRYPAITVEDVVKLCENASKSNAFEHCNFRIQEMSEWETIKEVLNLQPTASPEVYSIPNSNLFFHVFIDRFGMGSFKIYRN